MQSSIHLNDYHPFLASSSEINSILQPVSQHFGITSLVYQKNFFDGSEIRLTNQPAWIKYFFEKRLFQRSVFEHAPQQYSKMHYFWSALAHHDGVLSKAREFNIDHGVTLVEPEEDGCEFFFFGAPRNSPEVFSRVACHLDLLYQFVRYFKTSAVRLVQQAEQQRIFIPEKLIAVPIVSRSQAELNRGAFLSLINQGTQAVFSPREHQCMHLLQSGYTMKMIAQELNISYRTVETHFENIKRKTGCHTKAELVRYSQPGFK